MTARSNPVDMRLPLRKSCIAAEVMIGTTAVHDWRAAESRPPRMRGPITTDKHLSIVYAGTTADAQSGYIQGVTPRDVGALIEELNEVRAENSWLKSLLSMEEESLGEGTMPAARGDEISDIRSAKEAILHAMEVGEVFTYTDLLDKLNIDLELLVDACDDLMREGKIGERRSAA